MAELHIPGAVFTLVKEGQILYSKGYGYADLENKKPVIPDKTLFRIGSVSKLVTATAVMQLYEKGLLKLDADVNLYLKRFKVPPTFPQSITMANLLTHSAGLAEYLHGQHKQKRSDWLPLGEYLARRLPPRILPPGDIFIYNDHGFSLAGFVVEEIANLPFEAYIEKNILQPLGMQRSSFRQDLPAPLASDLAVGYNFQDSRYLPYPWDYCETVPAAGLNSTASDMTRFMIAHLQEGRLADVRILSEETAQNMQRRHFAHHPRLRGRAYGFSEFFTHDVRAIWHDGGMPGFNSRMYLIPSLKLGFFVSWNSDAMSLKWDLTELLLERFCPQAAKPTLDAPASDAQLRRKLFPGLYSEMEGLSPTCLKLVGLMNLVPVRPLPNHGLNVFGREYLEVAPYLFQEKSGDCIAFRQADGRIQYMFVGNGAFIKVKWYETQNVQFALMGFFLILFFPIGVVWPFFSFIRRIRHRDSGRRLLPTGRVLASLNSFLILFFLVALAFLCSQIDQNWQIMRNDYPWSLITRLLFIPLVTTPLSLVLSYFAIRAWIRKTGTFAGRVYFSLVALTALLFIPFLLYWRLLGFNY